MISHLYHVGFNFPGNKNGVYAWDEEEKLVKKWIYFGTLYETLSLSLHLYIDILQ